MGNYATLYFGGFEVWSTKSFIDPEIMTLFSKADCRKYRCPIEAGGRGPSIAAKALEALPADAEDVELVTEFSAPMWVVRDRLELMGYTLPVCIETFVRGLARQIEHLEIVAGYDRSWVENADPSVKAHAEAHDAERAERLVAIRHLDFRGWLAGLRELRARREISQDGDGDAESSLSVVARYMNDYQNEEHHLGWAYTRLKYFFRAALEILADDDWVVYDVTYLVDDNEEVELLARSTEERTVVLTEGVTDRRIMRQALEVLYPHLADYFFFVDLDAVNAAGGASAVVSIVKAFVGAGIKNHVIALLDNDTAAASALRGVARLALPENIRIVQYPNLPLAESYPTLGPSGKTNLNVNGLAGSIELYLGRDVLLDGNGDLAPIQWRGYDAALQRYQGEVLDKRRIQEAFERKVALCTEDPKRIDEFDWSGLRAIVDKMRTAFVVEVGELAE